MKDSFKTSIAVLTCGILVLACGCMSLTVRKSDERVIAEVGPLILERLKNLPADSDITARYGKFVELSGVSWNRLQSSFFVMPERLTWKGTARFEKASAGVRVDIARGTTVSLSLEMVPSEEWRLATSEECRRLANVHFEEVRDRYVHFRVTRTNGSSSVKSHIRGSAAHPEFLYRYE